VAVAGGQAGFKNALRVLRIRNYRVYTIGNAISLIGVWMQRIAVGWLAWQLTHSGFWLGMCAAGDLVPRRPNIFDEVRPPFRDPAKDEKRGPHARGGQYIQKPMRIVGDPEGDVVPLCARDAALEAGDVKIILHVDGQGVRRRAASRW